MVQQLSFSEPIILDLDRVALLSGDGRSTASGWNAVDLLVASLCEAEVAWADSRLADLARLSGQIADGAAAVGMTSFAAIARDVTALSDGRDPAALAAVLARLVRTGEASLTKIWDLQDLRV